MSLKILALDGLNNAKLCSLVEPILCTVKGVNSARIDYLSQRLTMDITGRETEEVVEEVMVLLRQTFPGVKVRLTDAAVLQQPKLNTTPYHRREAETNLDTDDDYYIDNDTIYDDELPEEDVEPKIPWTQRLREGAANLQTEKILLIIFWSCTGLSLLLLFLSGIWRHSSVNRPHLAAASYFFILFSGLFVGENARSENWLIRAAAVITTLGAFIAGYQIMAVLGFLVYILGVMYIDTFYNRFEEKLEENIQFCPKTVVCIRENLTLDIPPEEVREGDQILLEENMVLPFPGILEGEAATILPFGETEPHIAEAGDELHKGDRSLEGTITVTVTLPNPGAGIPAVREMVTNMPLDDAPLTSRAKVWTVVLTGIGLIAAATYYFSYYGLHWNLDGIYRTAVLVAAIFPCGLSVACHTAQKGCLSFLSNQGILLGSVDLLDRIPHLKRVVMNHIGFVTEGNLQVEEFVPAEGQSPEEVIEAAAQIEILVEGENLLSSAIVQYAFQQLGIEKLPDEEVEGFEVLEGYGIRGMYRGVLIMVGSERMMEEIGLEVPVLEDGRMAIYVAVRGEYAGAFVLNDSIREGSIRLIRELHKSGVEEVGLLTSYDGASVRSATLLTGADSSYIETSYVDRRLLLEGLKAKDAEKVAIIGQQNKIRQFHDVCICLETGCFMIPEEETLPRPQEVHLALPGPGSVSELLRSCQAINRTLMIGLLVIALPKAFLMAAAILWNIPLPLAFGMNFAISLLLYVLSSSLFSEIKREPVHSAETASAVSIDQEDQQDYM